MGNLIKLEAENILGVKAITLNLNGKSAYLKGKNGAGKSSTLEALAILLGQEKNGNPIRNGERKGKAVAEFEDFTVIKEFASGKVKSWKVVPKNGDLSVTPSEFFKNWIDDISFRPDTFIKKDKKARVKSLANALNIDIDSYEQKRNDVYLERRDVNRLVKEYEAKLSGLKFYSDAPDEELTSKDINSQMTEVNLKRHQKSATESHIRDFQNRVEQNKKRKIELEQEIEYLKKKLQECESKVDNIHKENIEFELGIEKLREDLIGFKTVDVEYQAITQKLASIEEINAKVRANKEFAEVKHKHTESQKRSGDLSDQIEEFDNGIRDAIEKSGLSGYSIVLEKDDIFVNDIEFDKLSTYEKLDFAMKVGLLIKSDKSSKILTMDVSQFDEDNRQKVIELAESHGYQGIFEIATKNRNQEDGDVPTFIIEDGEIVEPVMESPNEV